MEHQMIGFRIKIAAAAILSVLIFSCSQKYDASGIFDPMEPGFSADTLSFIAKSDTLVLQKDRISDGFVYLGRDISSSGDTTAWAESLIKLNLPETYGLDSSFVTYKLFEYPDTVNIDQAFEGKMIEILKTGGTWDADSISLPLAGLTVLDTVSVTADTSGTTYTLRFDLKKDMIEQWNAEDSTGTAGFFLRCLDGNDISPIIKFYSASWSGVSVRPSVNSFYSYPDSVNAVNGGDSTIYSVEHNAVTEDLTFGYKKPSCLTPDSSAFKLGGISGESYICRIPLDSIPENAVVLTGRISLKATGETDSVYGGIENNVITQKEIIVYMMTDSLWHSDPQTLNYDTLNVWKYKVNLGSDDNFLTMDGPVQNWISDPTSNFGFMITSANWGQPFGYTKFLKPEFNISYITTEGK
ncbi:MAG: hypothetical protein WC212_03290 [Candidatus Delongbacteria bacterium]